MSRFRRIEIVEPDYSPFFVRETSVFTPRALSFPSFVVEEHEEDLSFPLDLFSPRHDSFELFDTVTNLISVERAPSVCSYRRTQRRRGGTELVLQSLCDRVSALESRFDRLLGAKVQSSERKYTWTAEIKGPVDRKYRWTAEIKDGKLKKAEEKKYKWTAEIKGREEDESAISRKYTFEASTGYAGDRSKSEKKEEKVEKKKQERKKETKAKPGTRIIEIETQTDHGTLLLRDAFAKRAGASRYRKGKAKELSPQDAALLIQISFRAYLIRRSQSLRALKELAIAKAKLKEIRALFNNFSYRRQLARDGEERQRFSEKIIVLLLTVDGIEGADLMVRAAKRSMVDELEAMLDVVDPQPPGKSLSMRRRTFDMPDGIIRKEIAEGVAQVVQMMEQEGKAADTFEACL